MPVSDEQHLKNLKKNKADELKEIRRKNKEYETGMKYRKELVSINKSRQEVRICFECNKEFLLKTIDVCLPCYLNKIDHTFC